MSTPDAEAVQPLRSMRLRYAGRCRRCDAALERGTTAYYDSAAKKVECVACHSAPAHQPTPTDPTPPAAPPLAFVEGNAGESARREYERRQERRAQRVRDRHPVLGGLILNVTGEPTSTTAWATGAAGESRLGEGLNQRASPMLRLLHDRRVPRSTANIDHLAITPTGIWVIDAKRYKGKVTFKFDGLFSTTKILTVGGRRCNPLIGGMQKQLDVVRSVVGDEVPLHGVLCFVDADWPLLESHFTIDGVRVVWPKRLFKWLSEPGELGVDEIAHCQAVLASALPAHG